MRNPEQHKRQLIKALRLTMGLVTPACEMAHVSKRQYYRYYDTDPLFKEMVDEIREGKLDFVESKLTKKIKEEYWPAIEYYLDRKGKDRGYGKNLDITTKGESINVIVPPEKNEE